MRIAFLFLFATGFACLALDITTTDGTTFRHCEITRVEADVLVFSHMDGSARIPYEKLPKALQIQYFDPAKVEAYRKQQQEVRQAAVAKAAAVQRERDEATMKKQQEARRLAEETKRQENERRAEVQKQDDEKLRVASRQEFIQGALRTAPYVVGGLIACFLAIKDFSAFTSVIGGLMAFYFFFKYDTTVPVESHYIPGLGNIGGGRVVNLERMQNRQLGVIVGLALHVMGAGRFVIRANKSKTQ